MTMRPFEVLPVRMGNGMGAMVKPWHDGVFGWPGVSEPALRPCAVLPPSRRFANDLAAITLKTSTFVMPWLDHGIHPDASRHVVRGIGALCGCGIRGAARADGERHGCHGHAMA